MSNNIKFEILSNGSIRFNRGDKKHNDIMKEIISIVTGNDVDEELIRFFSGSEDTELILGERMFCG